MNDDTEKNKVSAYSVNGTNDDAALSLYLKDISQINLLTHKEEVKLFRQIAKAKKPSEREALCEKMITANLRLVVKIAKKYVDKGLPLLDLISEGNIGLIKAVKRYDLKKGSRLSNYAPYLIKDEIRRALSFQSRTIRLPDRVFDSVTEVRKAIEKLCGKLGRDPTREEIAKKLGVPLAYVDKYSCFPASTISLDSMIGDSSTTVGEVIPDDNAVDPFDNLSEIKSCEILHWAVGQLSERESEILKYRFGLNNYPEESANKVRVRFGITRQRIYQIEAVAIYRLRIIIERLERTGVLAGTNCTPVIFDRNGKQARSYSCKKL